jgi:Skp family chaperone for outer membrane proteins
MRTILLAAGVALAAFSATAAAQGDAPAAAPAASCYIELHKLMAEPPTGIGDLGAAIRALDVKLRPQVEEINALKAQIARLEQREPPAAPSTSVEAAFDDGDREAAPAPVVPRDDGTAEEIRTVRAQLDARQAQLKLDYDEQRAAIVGPVQARVGQRVQAFATERGCSQVKMARAPDLAALTAAGAQDVTGEFVTWYLANPAV